MRIGGLQKLTLVDFPGRIASTVFVQGCNFRCGYCHNPELVLPQAFQEPLLPEMVFNFLEGRRGVIEGVVITGGEPTLQKELPDFIACIKQMGFAVKLDTNGSRPDVLASLLESRLLDYIAMDVKTCLDKYSRAIGVSCDTAKIKESIRLVINSNVPYQLRTTLIKEFCAEQDLNEIKHLIGQANHYVLQPFVHSPKMIDPRIDAQDQYTPSQVESFKAKYDRVKTG